MMLLILTLNGTVVMAEDDKKKDADYNIQNTTDGKYNANGTLSLSLKIDSYKEDFNGTIKLYVGNTEWNTYASTAYEKPVSIEKGKSKEIVFEVGYDYEHTGKLWYELIDEKGNVVYDREDSITLMQSGMGMTMGILTDDFSNFSFLNEGSAFQLELWGERVNFTITGLDETTFPEDKNAMDEFDFLFIDQFYTDKLSEEQMNVLLQWLNSGGMLLVGTGANAVDTLSGFDGTDFGIQFNGTTIEQEIHLTEFGISDYENRNPITISGLNGLHKSSPVSCFEVGRAGHQHIGAVLLADAAGIGVHTAVHFNEALRIHIIQPLPQLLNLIHLICHEFLTAETGFYSHNQNQIALFQIGNGNFCGGSGLQNDTGLTAQGMDLVQGIQNVLGLIGFHMDGQPVGTGLNKLLHIANGTVDHQVHIQRQIGNRTQGLYHGNADGNIGYENTVHNVHMDPVGTIALQVVDIPFQICKISG